MKNIIYGKNTVLDAIKNNSHEIKELFISENVFLKTNIKKTILSTRELNEITSGNHQGYIASIEPFKYYEENKIFSDKPEVIVLLDHVEDPQNLGSIIRTMSALGVSNHLVIPNDRAATINSTVAKVASGALSLINVTKTNSLISFIEKAKKNNYWIYSTSLKEVSSELNNINFNFPLVIIFGNEAKGISRTIEKSSDQLVYIKLNGKTQSLNVAISAGILLNQLNKN